MKSRLCFMLCILCCVQLSYTGEFSFNDFNTDLSYVVNGMYNDGSCYIPDDPDADCAVALDVSTHEGMQYIYRTIKPHVYTKSKPDAAVQAARERATHRASKYLQGVLYYNPMSPFFLNDGSIQVPASLRAFPIPVMQLCVIKQREPGTCGSRSVTNALALEEIVYKGLPLTSKNLQSMSKKYEYLHTKNGLTMSDQLSLASSLGLRTMYSLIYLKQDPLHNQRLNVYPFTIIGSTELGLVNLYQESQVIEAMVHKIAQSKNIVAHFMCFLEGRQANVGHSVCISLVKRAGYRPCIVYMDSNNGAIAEQSQVSAYISYLYWQCLA
ncbi:MAG TPA: hypothetical protein PKD74_04795 [Candidatus Dependentiae bacterium]|nr:hypothetical protein [Candidatus Dependentiae bacterium]